MKYSKTNIIGDYCPKIQYLKEIRENDFGSNYYDYLDD